MKSMTRSVLLGLSLTFSTLIHSQSTIPGNDFGYTKGSFTVTETGAALYNTHIILAGGLGGLQPDLSIIYNSQGGNGPLGLGFSLQGLSAISRSPRNYAEDGELSDIANIYSPTIESAINFNLFDRYTLDGERLRLAYNIVPESTPVNYKYGFPGTVYLTEQNKFAKIILDDTANGGPTFFKVYTKDGLIKYYGNTSDSKIELAENKPTHWLINDVEDRNGNFIHYKYFQNKLTGEYFPIKIEYSGNSKLNKAAQDSVIFIYEDRFDSSSNYFKGIKFDTKKRLKEIKCYSLGKLIRDYQLSYYNREQESYSFLSTIQEFGTNAKALSPTNFQWNFSNYGQYFLSGTNTVNPSFVQNSPANKYVQTGDFNGDGLSDIMTFNRSTGECKFLLNQYPGGSFNQASTNLNFGNNSNLICLSTDFNADGRSDLFFYDTTTGRNLFFLTDFKNNQLSFYRQHTLDSSELSSYLKSDGTGSARVALQDFTNDGLPDLFVYKQKGTNLNLGWNALFINTGIYNNNETIKLIQEGQILNNLDVGNLRFSYQNYFIGMTFGYDFPNLPNSLRDFSQLLIADLDNNGYPDYFLYNKQTGQSAIYYAYTKSSFLSFYEKQSYAENADSPILNVIDPNNLVGNDSTELQFVDINSDGLPDLLLHNKLETTLKCWVNKGNFKFDFINLQGFSLKDLTVTEGLREIRYEDVDLDGKCDITFYNKTTGANRVYFNKGNLLFSFGQIESNDLFNSSKLDLEGQFNVNVSNNHLIIDPSTGNNNLYNLGTEDLNRHLVYINEPTKAYSIDYSNLVDTTCYKRNVFYDTYPTTEFQNHFSVVRDYVLLDGLVGIPIQNGSTYQYEGARTSLDGRGFRGFLKVIEHAPTGINTTKYYYRDTSSFIYVGDPISKVVTTATTYNSTTSKYLEQPVSESDYTLDYKYYPVSYFGMSFYSYTKENVSTNYETNGKVASTTVTRQSIDDYGNPTTMVLDYGGGYKDSTINNYYNDTANWILGRLIHATLYRYAPNKPVSIRNSEFQYNPSSGQLTQEVSFSDLDEKSKLTKTYHYDSYGNIIQSDDYGWNGHTFETRSIVSEYDTTGKFIIKVTNPLGFTTSQVYDVSTGKVLSTTNENGLRTQYQYDDLGRLKKETFPDGNWLYYDYKFYNVNISKSFKPFHDPSGLELNYAWAIIKQSSTEGNSIEFYDDLDRKIGAEKVGFNGTGVTQEIGFNQQGLVGSQGRWHYSNESSQYTSISYDIYGRLKYRFRPGNIIDSVVYLENKKIKYNSLGQKKTIISDSKNQVVRVVDDNGQTLSYDYDANGNLLKITDAKGNTLSNEFDLKGNKTQMTDLDLGIYKYQFNAFNELISQTYASGNLVQFEYDKVGRVLKRTQKEGVTTWTYDQGNKAIGKVSSILNYDSSGEKYSYDSLGRLYQTTKTINKKGYKINVSYNQQGKIDTLTYPSGFAVKNIYNSYGYLMEVRRTSDRFLYWRADRVNAQGMVEVQEQANAVLTEYFYNSQTLLIDSLRGSNPSNFFNRWQFRFNSLGSLLSRTNEDINKTENFTYDNLNRLVKSYITNGDTVSIKYDELGNIIDKSDVGSYEYGGVNNGPHRVVQINQYNPQCIPSAHVKYEYTSFNKVSNLSNDTASLEIQYGFDQQRNYARYYLKGELSTTKTYVSDLFEIDSTSNNQKQINFVVVNGSIVASFVVDSGKGKSFFWFKDHLGSVTAITDSVGKVLQLFSYDAWGKRRDADWTPLSDSSYLTDKGFTGQQHYDLFDLVDMNGRIYDPVIGRFTSADPFIQDISNLQNFNRYSYVLNNPLSSIDPSGYFDFNPFHWIGDAINAVGSAVGAIGSAVGSAASWVKDNWKTLVVVTAVVATTVLTGGGASAFWITVASGAAGGFAGNFTATLLNGGSITEALTSGLKGAVIGGATAALTYGIGSVASNLGTYGDNVTAGGLGIKIVGHGVVQGGVEAVNGGQFLHGLYSGAISGAYGAYSPQISTTFGARVFSAAALGGLTSQISGGKFVNGAITGAYVQMFNEEAHMSKPKEQLETADKVNTAVDAGVDALKEITEEGGNAGQYLTGAQALTKSIGGAYAVYSVIDDVSNGNYGKAFFEAAVYGAGWAPVIGPFVGPAVLIAPYIPAAASSFNSTSIEFKKATGDNFLHPGKF